MINWQVNLYNEEILIYVGHINLSKSVRYKVTVP